jgi:peroxiredoxin
MRGFIAALALIIATGVYAQDRVQVGDQAPAFRLPYATKDTIDFAGLNSEDLAGKAYLLAFYPADWSGGCTKEVCTFRDNMAVFNDLDVTVLGISVDSPFSHRRWAQEENLNFKLLSDQTHEFGKAMGVYSEESGIFKRSVFVVGPDARFKYVDYEYSVKDDQDLEALKKAMAAK